MRGWYSAESGLAGKHLTWSFTGIAAMLALGAGFVMVAMNWREADERRSAGLEVLTLVWAAESDLAAAEAAHSAYLLAGQVGQLEKFQRRRAAFHDRCVRLAEVLRARRDEVYALGGDFHLWLDSAALPAIEARARKQDVNALVARDPGKPLLERLHATLSRLANGCGEDYSAANSAARWHHQLQTAGIALLSVAAVGFLIASTWTGRGAFQRHLLKAEAAYGQTRAIIATTLDGVVTVDDQGRILSMNPAAEKMFVQTEREMAGKNIALLIPQRLLFHDMANLSRGAMMAMGQRQGYYPFPIEISLSEMTIGGRRQFVALIRDVSERRRSEDILKHISLGVSAVTGEEFVRSLVKHLSKALQNDFAFLVEVSGRGDEAINTVTIAAQGVIQSSKVLDLSRSACGEALAKGLRVFPKGVREKFPEDAILHDLAAESFVGVPLVDHKGSTVGLMGVLDRKPLDDTQVIESALQIFAARAAAEIERKRFEEDLAAEKERLAVTLRSIGEGFLTINNEGLILLMNAVAESLTGWSQREAIGRQLQEVFQLIHEKTRRRCQHGLVKMVETGASDEITYPALLVARDGAERLVECTTSPIRDTSNRKVGVVIVFHDVTDRQRAAEERQKNEKLESLGVVAGGIAHDFNNLLTAILGNLTLVLNAASLGAKPAEQLKAAKKATARAQELAGKLLTFAKGGVPIKQTMSIGPLVRDTVTVTLTGSKAWTECSFPDDVWPVDIDPGQVSQVINNLALNADQAMPAGGTIRVGAENCTLATDDVKLGLPAGRWVRITVQDEGVGIAEEYLKKIFDPYFTTKPKGSGMGLATAYSIVKNHGGTIAVESEPGMGSHFTIHLPASERQLPSAMPALPSEPPPEHARVLVLDDEEAICTIIQCTLEDLGYEVAVTNDGAAAIAAYEKAMQAGRPFDLVISDLTIPGGMGGKEAIQRLCEIDPAVRAIVSSGYGNDPVMSRHQEFGFTGMIAKPYEIDALERKVAEVLAMPRREHPTA